MDVSVIWRESDVLEKIRFYFELLSVVVMSFILTKGARDRFLRSLIGSTPRFPRASSLSLEEEIAAIRNDLAVDKAWSLTAAAKEALGAGSLNSTPVEARDMEMYMRMRGFDQAAQDPRSPAYRTLSAAMTFPLTLAYGVNRIFAGRTTGRNVRIYWNGKAPIACIGCGCEGRIIFTCSMVARNSVFMFSFWCY